MSSADLAKGDRVRAIGGAERRRSGKTVGMVGIVQKVTVWDGLPTVFVFFPEMAQMGDVLYFPRELERVE